MTKDENRNLAERAYSLIAHDYVKNPIGSRDWCIFWEGWCERGKVATDAEPVAVVGDVFSLYWVGSGPIAPLVERHGIKVGSKLYAAPQTENLKESDRLEFVIRHQTSWYPQRAPNSIDGILCFNSGEIRKEVAGLTMRIAIDAAMEIVERDRA